MSVESQEPKKPFGVRRALATVIAPLALSLSACAPNSVEAVPGAQTTRTATPSTESSPSFGGENYKKYPEGTIDQITSSLEASEDETNTFNSLLNEGLLPRVNTSLVHIIQSPGAIDQVSFDWVSGGGRNAFIAQFKKSVEAQLSNHPDLQGYYACPLPTDQGSGWNSCAQDGYSSLMIKKYQDEYPELKSGFLMQGNTGGTEFDMSTETFFELTNYEVVQQPDGGLAIEVE